MFGFLNILLFFCLLDSSTQLRNLLIANTPEDDINQNPETRLYQLNPDSNSLVQPPKDDLRFDRHQIPNSIKYRYQNLTTNLDTKFMNSPVQNKTPTLSDLRTHLIMNTPDQDDLSPDAFIGPDGKLRISICDHPNGFLRRQKKLCRQYLHLMESVVRGYFMGLRECEYQFAQHRWNCQGHNVTIKSESKSNRRRLRNRQSGLTKEAQVSSTSSGSSSNQKPIRIKTYMDRLLSKGTRESAYVLAVTSAGVSHAVTKACSSGVHDNCGCDRTIYDHPREPNFEWSGCSDNIHFGAAFSRQFLDVRERGRLKRNPKLGLANLHNNHVGRQTVINKMEVQCKCHGVSGSCEMRTCWRSLPKFRSLGAYLRERFREAVQVEYVDKRLVPVSALDQLRKEANENALTGGSQTGPSLGGYSTSSTGTSLPVPKETDLIYTSDSPTFCHHDPRFGSIGTYGRQCEENSQGLNSCHYLCCGRGFKRQTFVQEERCDCKFQWCCKVICKTCRKTVVVSTCN